MNIWNIIDLKTQEEYQARFNRFRSVELEAADSILNRVMTKLGMKSTSSQPTVCIGKHYANKLQCSEKARRKLWAHFSRNFIPQKSSYAWDDAAFAKLNSDIKAVRTIYLHAIDLSDEKDLPMPPDQSSAKEVFDWIDRIQEQTGAGLMLESYFEHNVPLEHIVAT